MILQYTSRKKNIVLGCLLFVISIISSCTKDENTSPNSTSGDNRNRYTGSWLCMENGTTSFTVNITKKGIADTLLIDNFSGYGSTTPLAFAVVNGNSMTIPAQNITITNIAIDGTGVMNSSGAKITMNYTANGTAITAICTH